MYQAPWAHRLPQRQFVFDARSRCVYGNEVFSSLDDRLRQQITQHCGHRLSRLGNATEIQADRLQMPDSRGDLWTFRVVPFKSYGAFGTGAYVFFCLQPEASDWATIRPNDFQADPEMVRLVPAVRFMQQEFHRSPSLGEIARVVHLSPFHFHRRFTELLGLTPKHFLLECQIYEAKRQLMARQKHLSQIASDCGFAHQSHFTSRFKQATGLTPTRWRRVAQDLQRASV
jgi:AraC-like DNA-binding protein